MRCPDSAFERRRDECVALRRAENEAVLQKFIALVTAIAFVIGTPSIAIGRSSRPGCCCGEVARHAPASTPAVSGSCACCTGPVAPDPAPGPEPVQKKVPERRSQFWIEPDAVQLGIVIRLPVIERRSRELTRVSKRERRRHATLCRLLR